MAGHSQRAKIKHFKGAIDAERAIAKELVGDRAAVGRLIEAREGHDDVKEVYSKAELVE